MVSLDDNNYSNLASLKLKKGDTRKDGYRFWKNRKWKRKDGTITITGLWLSPEVYLKEEQANRDRSRENSSKRRKLPEYKEKHSAYCLNRFKNIKVRKKRLKYLRVWRKNKFATDPIFLLKDSVRRRINEALQNIGEVKNKKTEEILGCSFSFLKAYIESRFNDGMSWDNRNLWHIDHIVPLSSAKTATEILKLNHYSNLRPLWAKDNISKGNKPMAQQLNLI